MTYVFKGEGPFLEFIYTGYIDKVSIEGMSINQKKPTKSDAVMYRVYHLIKGTGEYQRVATQWRI